MSTNVVELKKNLGKVALEFESLRKLVGGSDSWYSIVLAVFETGDEGEEKEEDKPKLLSKLEHAARDLKGALGAEERQAFVKSELKGLREAWEGSKIVSDKVEEVQKSTEKFSQHEYNKGVAREILKDRKKKNIEKTTNKDQGRLLGVESTVKSDKEVDDRVLNLPYSKPRDDIDKRLELSKESLLLGCKLMGEEKNCVDAAKAFRHGLWMSNFENREDIVFWESNSTSDMRRRCALLTAQLHQGLAEALLDVGRRINDDYGRRMLIGAEAASQASGALDLNGELTECVYLRAMGRSLAEDFKAAEVDIKECIRREPQNQKFKEGQKRLEREKIEALKREKALWKRDGKKLKKMGYTFMGQEDTPGIVGWFLREGRKHVILYVILVMLTFVFFYDHEKLMSWVKATNQVERELNKLKMLKDRGFTDEFIENNPWLMGKGTWPGPLGVNLGDKGDGRGGGGGGGGRGGEGRDDMGGGEREEL